MRRTKLDDKLEEFGYVRTPSITIDKSFCLYDKDNHKFKAVFSLDGKQIVYNGKKYKEKEIPAFLMSVESDIKELYFDPDTYNPDYRKEFVDKQRIHDTLSSCNLYDNECAYRNRGYLFGDNMGGKFAEVHGTDLILSEMSWIPLMNEGDPVDEETCGRMKSMLGAVYATHIAMLIDALNNMGKMNMVDSIEVKTFNENTMSIDTKNGKAGIIAKLEEVLANLKDEK